MKKLSIIMSTFCIMFTFAQKVSDYKYVVLPEKYEDFKKNHFGMDKVLAKILKTKKYTVLSSENKSTWPSEATNQCKLINANILNASSLFRTKVTVEFKDCDNKVLSSYKGMSLEKEYEIGYPEALTEALVTLPFSNPIVKEIPVENTVISEPNRQSEKYSNGKLSLQKIQLDATQFILVDGNSSVPFATFKETTKKDVFRVKLGSGESTTGYYENGNLIIEIPKGNDEYSKEVFSAVK